jgi:heme A synthase
MAILGLLAAGVLLILLAVLAWRRARASRGSTGHGAVTEEQARQNAAPLTTAILSGSRTQGKSTDNAR